LSKRRRPPVKTWSTPVTKENSFSIPCALCGGGQFAPSLACEGFSYVKCAACGLVQINPQPSAADVELRYKDSRGGEYFLYELKNEAAFLELQKLALADAGFYRLERELMRHKEKAPRVLDIGCATGAMPAFLKERGWQAAGIEISPAAAYARNVRGLDVLSTSLENSSLPGDSFDLVLASHVIEHLNNPRQFVSEVWRILRPGAFLFLTTPNINGFQARLFGGQWRSVIFDHLYLFSVQTIKAMLKAGGFAADAVFTWGGLAEGTAPRPLKRLADRMVKITGQGDVMLVKARKP